MTNLASQPQILHRVRSFIRRDSRATDAQTRAYHLYWPELGINKDQGLVAYENLFHNNNPCYLEIGFGMGTTLVQLAQREPDKNFIGIDIHKPGIGSVFAAVKALNISNLRLFDGDAVEIFENCIPDNSLSGVQIFFPDPWPKRKHHPRRLIQTAFIQLLAQKLMLNASLHLATDWEDYAKHMLKVFAADTPAALQYRNLFGQNTFATRSVFRPSISKFEARAIKEGRNIWELQFEKSC